MSYLIGVDGGGTGCRVVVADQSGNILSRAEGGAANIATDLESARANILSTITDAFNLAGKNHADVQKSVAVLGLAGANLGDYRQQLLASLPFSHANIVSDGETTLVGAIGEGEGCIAAIGTGSVYGRRDTSGYTQLGGWGFLLGDDGSGGRLGRDFLHQTILAYDGIAPHSPLTLEILDEYQGSPKLLIELAMDFSPGDFGRFAPRIVAAAKAGDEVAEALMARHTKIVRKSIDTVGFDPSKAFCMLGGLGPIYLERLDDKYQKAARAPLGNALDGALALAKHL